MGTPALNAIQPFDLTQALATAQSAACSDKGHGQVAKLPALGAELGFPRKAAELLLGKGPSVAEDFAAVVYHAQMAQVGVAMQLEQASAAISEDGGEAAAEAVQMTFDFFGEVRTEELAVFQQRTSTVAEGLEGTTRETYIEVSREVAARFEMSMSVSGQSLSGLARASESQQDDPAGMEQVIGLAQNALAGADEVMDEIFALLDGFFGGGDDDLGAAFAGLIQAIYQSGMLGLSGETAEPAEGTTSAATQSFSFNIQLEFEFSAQIQVTAAEVQQADPIVLDLDGDGIELTSYAKGARFDLLGNGTPVNTAFVTGGDALLAIDRNGNGTIDSGKELFGEQNGAAHGFAELAKLDSNRDGVINRLDDDFDKLVLFRDNGNGRTEEGELISLEQAGIAEISLGYRNVSQRAAGGNALAQIASFRRADGSTGQVADALLNFTV